MEIEKEVEKMGGGENGEKELKENKVKKYTEEKRINEKKEILEY